MKASVLNQFGINCQKSEVLHHHVVMERSVCKTSGTTTELWSKEPYTMATNEVIPIHRTRMERPTAFLGSSDAKGKQCQVDKEFNITRRYEFLRYVLLD